MSVPDHLDVTTPSSTAGSAPMEGSVSIDDPIVCFGDGQHVTFTRVTILANGVLSAELTRNVLDGSPGSAPAYVTDTVHYSPSAWHHVFTAPRGVLTAWTWRRNDAGDIEQHQHVVATNITAETSRDQAISWLRRYAIAEAQLRDIADLAFAQRVTVSDPETIALKFFFHLPPVTPSSQSPRT